MLIKAPTPHVPEKSTNPIIKENINAMVKSTLMIIHNVFLVDNSFIKFVFFSVKKMVGDHFINITEKTNINIGVIKLMKNQKKKARYPIFSLFVK